MDVDNLLGRIRGSLDDLSERERRLVLALGGVFIAIVVLLPVYLLTTTISDMEDENQEIADVLQEFERERPAIAARQATERAAQQRYANPAPPLGSFLEAKATEQSLTLREVNDQPEQVLGSFTRRSVRATMPNVGLKPVVNMLTEIANSDHPVTVARIEVEHFRSGDQYNIQVGINAYDRNRPQPRSQDAEEGDR